MKITSDWHIHSRNSCDSACIEVQHLINRAREQGITDFGLTDHLHTPYNTPDIIASRKEFLACNPSDRFHFGIEVSCVSRWEIDEIAKGQYENPVYGLRSDGPANAELAIGITAEDVEQYAIEYIVAGTHWPIYVPQDRDVVIRDYHRQNMFLATHPLVTIVAHPWWWMGWWRADDGTFPTDPWLDDFAGKIPQSMHDEFAAAARQHDTVVEINICANLLSPNYPEAFKRDYMDYIGFLHSKGVKLSIGSDCHNADYDIDFETAAKMIEGIGITEDDLWCMEPRQD